jgi:tetratricopeptide (TPR) repeat protein
MGAVSWDARTAQWRVRPDFEEVAVPDTVQGVIMARIDRLEEGLKEVLKTASVIGRSFLYRVIQAITEAGADVDRRLGELVRVELLLEGRRVPEIEYLFRHPLVQEVTYDSMLSDRRRTLHRLVGECVESLFPERREEFYGLLAYHFSRAEVWEKAHAYLVKAGDQAGRLAGDAEALVHYKQAVAAYERIFGARGDPLERAGLERRIGEALFRRGEHDEAMERFQRALESLGGLCIPESRLGVGLAIGRAALTQAWHRMRPIRPAERATDPHQLLVSKERVRIYRMFGWIDYFRDSQRLALDALLSLNVAEEADLAEGMAFGLSGMGILFDQLPLRRIAEVYHRKALHVAKQVQNPVTLGFAYLGLGWHRYSGGDWSEADRLFGAAASRFKEAGELREWGLAAWSQDQVFLLQGRFRESEQIVTELLRVGRDAGDKEVLGWGLQDRGILSACREGASDEAIRSLEESINLLGSVPDYLAVVCSRGYLGQCVLQRGEIGPALEIFRENRRLMAKHRVRGPYATPSINGSAAAYLAAADHAPEGQKRRLLRLAGRACRAALQHAKSVPDGAPAAYRLRGTHAWLASDSRAAVQWWTRSLEIAQRLGARYDLGLTYLEQGERLKDPASLKRAEALFGELDAPGPRADAARFLREG